MEGSRLFILSPYPEVVTAWVDELTSRMRARRLFDRLPGTKVVAHPWATPAQPFSHNDRIYLRDMLSKGSTMQRVDTEPTHTAALDELLDEWTERQRRASWLHNYIGGWGDPYGKILFVGGSYDDKRGLPFSGLGKIARTMSALLNAAGLREPELHMIAACGADMLRPRLAHLAAYETVALGTSAHEQLIEAGVKSFVQFPHPYYLADMSPARIVEWGKKLRTLVEHAIV